ncbi:MAG: PHB depolymerase family esterase [Elusimicrobiota bacterium]
MKKRVCFLREHLKRILISIGCLWLAIGLTVKDAEAGSIREKIKERQRERMEEKNSKNTPYPLIEEKCSSYIQSQCEAGDYRRHLEFDGRKRFYDLHIPQGYNKEKAMPVVLVFHGGGGNPVQQRNDSQMDKVSDAHGFIVVYPAGTGKLEDKFLTFNSGNGFGYANKNNVDDVGWTKALLDDVETLCHTDKNRVYATGFSNGAFMCYRLAFELSDRIAAFAPVSGVLGVETSIYKLDRPISIIHFHGLNDPNVAYHGGIGPKAFEKIPRPSVSETIYFWTNHNGCPKKSIKESWVGKAVCTIYAPGREGSEVILWTLEDGGHAWPGGKSSLPEKQVGKVNMDISASELIWQFFEKHPRQER